MAAIWRDFHMSTLLYTMIRGAKESNKTRLFDSHFLALYPEFRKRNVYELGF